MSGGFLREQQALREAGPVKSFPSSGFALQQCLWQAPLVAVFSSPNPPSESFYLFLLSPSRELASACVWFVFKVVLYFFLFFLPHVNYMELIFFTVILYRTGLTKISQLKGLRCRQVYTQHDSGASGGTRRDGVCY